MVSLEQVNWFSNNQWHKLMVKSIWSGLLMSNWALRLCSMNTVTNSLQISGACSAFCVRQN